VGSVAKKVGEGLGNVVKTGLLGAVALGVAGKILEIW
jgi:outer membrane lipoprotein SlyB